MCLCWEHTSPRGSWHENTFAYVWPKLRFWPCGQEWEREKKSIHQTWHLKEQRAEWLRELIPSLWILNVGFGESWEDLPSVPLTPWKRNLSPLFCFLDYIHFPADGSVSLTLVLIHQHELCLAFHPKSLASALSVSITGAGASKHFKGWPLGARGQVLCVNQRLVLWYEVYVLIFVCITLWPPWILNNNPERREVQFFYF